MTKTLALIAGLLLACNIATAQAPAPQPIDAAWLAANAAAFGGSPTAGPWVLGRAFGGYPLPAAAGGLCPYALATDVAADGTAFVVNGAVQLDLAGHAITFDDATAQPGAFDGEFEDDVPGAAPAGWDLAGCVEAAPAVFDPVASGLPSNMLFGSRTLAWTGANQVPAALPVTAAVDGSGSIVFTFAGPAPAIGREVFPAGFVAPALPGTPLAQAYQDVAPYFVLDHPAANAIRISTSRAGAPVKAASITAKGKVGVAQVIRVGPVSIPQAGVWYAFKHGMAMADSHGWGGGGGIPILCHERITDAVTGRELPWEAIAELTADVPAQAADTTISLSSFLLLTSAGPRSQLMIDDECVAIGSFPAPNKVTVKRAQSGTVAAAHAAGTACRATAILGNSCQVNGGYRATDYPVTFRPSTTNPVYLEIATASSGYAVPVMIDGIRLTRAYVYGLMATTGYQAPGFDQLPGPMQPAGIAPYNKARDLIVVDSAGGGAVLQGRGKARESAGVFARSNVGVVDVIGKPGAPIRMTVTGDDCAVVAASNGVLGKARIFADIEAAHGPGVDVASRLYPVPTFTLGPMTGDILLTRVNASNVPQTFMSVYEPYTGAGAYAAYTFAMDGCNVAMNAVATNCYAVNIANINHARLTNCNVTGFGWGFSCYTIGTADLSAVCNDFLVDNCTFDLTHVMDREAGALQLAKCAKMKDVAPGPYAAYRNILVRNSVFRMRGAGGAARLVYGLSWDVRNGNNPGGNGNIRLIGCTFESSTDGVPAIYPLAGQPYSCAIEWDQVDPGMFPIFDRCTLASTNVGMILNGPDGSGCQGAVLSRSTFRYNPLLGPAADRYYAMSAGGGGSTFGGLWLLDCALDPGVPAGYGRVLWSGSGLFASHLWNYALLDGGSGYTGKPTIAVPSPPGGANQPQAVVVAMGPDDAGNPAGAVKAIALDNYGGVFPGYLNVAPPPVAFAGGGAPTRQAAAVPILYGDKWPFRSYRVGTAVALTVTEADGLTPVQGATVTVVDDGGNQVFPAPEGSVNTDGTSMVPTTTDAAGHIGLAADVPLIPLPLRLVTQGDPTAKQTLATIAGTTALDGTGAALTAGSVTSTPTASFTVTVARPGRPARVLVLAVAADGTITTTTITTVKPGSPLTLPLAG